MTDVEYGYVTEILANQRRTQYMVGALLIIQMFIFFWKLYIYPQLMALVVDNKALLEVVREVFNNMRSKQDTTIRKQDTTIRAVGEVKEVVQTIAAAPPTPDPFVWRPGDADRRHPE